MVSGRRALAVLFGFSMAACTRSGDHDVDTASARPGNTQPQAPPSGGLQADPDPEGAARSLVLYLSPEGGGTRSAFSREQLRKPSNWVVHSGRQAYTFAPLRRLTKLTAKVGRHFNCLEYPLASRLPDLARLPHVGVKLEPDSLTSCLESWNATFVFDASEQTPRLAAAVYDQWEW